MVGVDRTTAPTAVTNSRGEFAFVDVEPGRYGLMLDTIQAILLLNDPADGGNFLVEVSGGEIEDIGEIAIHCPIYKPFSARVMRLCRR
ncbi:MAG: hypothetical protein HC822_05665 [Oscillochloris sp.]|nr:hypothetical protein [Oscillochloris sp.]